MVDRAAGGRRDGVQKSVGMAVEGQGVEREGPTANQI